MKVKRFTAVLSPSTEISRTSIRTIPSTYLRCQYGLRRLLVIYAPLYFCPSHARATVLTVSLARRVRVLRWSEIHKQLQNSYYTGVQGSTIIQCDEKSTANRSFLLNPLLDMRWCTIVDDDPWRTGRWARGSRQSGDVWNER